MEIKLLNIMEIGDNRKKNEELAKEEEEKKIETEGKRRETVYRTAEERKRETDYEKTICEQKWGTV